MPRLSIRIDFDDDGRLGPGKVLLLERIAEHGSISAATLRESCGSITTAMSGKCSNSGSSAGKRWNFTFR